MKLQRLVDKLAAGEFDENDIDLLLIQLRERCFDNHIFHELAHFVAHRRIRDRGTTRDRLDAFALSIRYFLEFPNRSRVLDLGQPFAIWVKQLMLYQVDRCDPDRLRERSALTREQLRSRISKLFVEDKKSGACSLTRKQIDPDVFEALKYILSFICAKPAFTQTEIIDEFVKVLERNGLKGKSLDAIWGHQNRVMAAILCLLHHTKFSLDVKTTGQCFVDCESAQGFVLRAGPPDFGKLIIRGQVAVHLEGVETKVALHLIASDLDAWSNCQTLRQEIQLIEGAQDPRMVTLNFEGDIALGHGTELVRPREVDQDAGQPGVEV